MIKYILISTEHDLNLTKCQLKSQQEYFKYKKSKWEAKYKALESNKSGNSKAAIQVEDFKGQLQKANLKIKSLQTNLIITEPHIRPKITCSQKPFNSLNNLVLAIATD